jgi:hypothetical protein
MVKTVKSSAAPTFEGEASIASASIASEYTEHSPSRRALEDRPQGESFGTSAIKARTAANNDVLTKF